MEKLHKVQLFLLYLSSNIFFFISFDFCHNFKRDIAVHSLLAVPFIGIKVTGVAQHRKTLYRLKVLESFGHCLLKNSVNAVPVWLEALTADFKLVYLLLKGLFRENLIIYPFNGLLQSKICSKPLCFMLVEMFRIYP